MLWAFILARRGLAGAIWPPETSRVHSQTRPTLQLGRSLGNCRRPHYRKRCMDRNPHQSYALAAFLQSGQDLAQIRMVVSECGDSPMRASLKLLASAALCIGLASTAFAHNNLDFRDTNGTFITGNRAAARFPNGVIFSGNFVGPVSWTLTSLSNGTHHYALTGVLTGMTGGVAINAITSQLTININRGSDGSATISGGEKNREESVPEPSTFALLGTGSLTLLGIMRRRNGATRN